jgi:hypothetical protein
LRIARALREKVSARPNLSLLAIISFVTSFAIARIFTSIHPDTVLIGAGFHIHHFWYGIILLSVGGWLGISYNGERIDRLAAVVYGAGGGLIGDEVGLLLTLGYWTSLTYTLVVVFLTFVSTFVLFRKYSKTVWEDIEGFATCRASFYFGVLLAAVSVSFVTSGNFLVSTVAIFMTVFACLIMIAFVVQRVNVRHHGKKVLR